MGSRLNLCTGAIGTGMSLLTGVALYGTTGALGYALSAALLVGVADLFCQATARYGARRQSRQRLFAYLKSCVVNRAWLSLGCGILAWMAWPIAYLGEGWNLLLCILCGWLSFPAMIQGVWGLLEIDNGKSPTQGRLVAALGLALGIVFWIVLFAWLNNESRHWNLC